MKRILIFISVLVISFSCSNSNDSDRDCDAEIQAIFDKFAQLIELNTESGDELQVQIAIRNRDLEIAALDC